VVKRHSGVRRRGLTAYKVHELLTGEIDYPVLPRYYDGYGNPALLDQRSNSTANYITDAMRQDWEANREVLMKFWRSGKYTTTDNFAQFGLNVSSKPWLFVSDSRPTLPWAAKQFD